MAKFDVYENEDGPGYLLDCQADLLAGLRTRFVIPIVPVGTVPRFAERLNPVFEVAGANFIMATNLAATVEVSALGTYVGSLRDHEFAIGNAIDMLLSGY